MRTLTTAARTSVLATGVGALLFTGVAAGGTAVAAPQAQPAKLTVKEYRSWLMNNDDLAASQKVLKAFDKLPGAKQRKFVGYLQNRAVTKAFVLSFAGGVKKGNTKEVRYNDDVRFSGVVKGSNRVVSGGRDISLTFTATERVYGIPVVTQKVDFSYTVKNGVKARKVKRSVVNMNRAFVIKPVKNAVSGTGTITATVTWNLAPQYGSVGKGPLVKKQAITSFAGQKFGARLSNA
ncbi:MULTISPECIES: hypothetical protein [Streptomyces]|uniref:Secreted protein n=1 Tax=Streptomyces caniscabiei TaxID=2746961 RepID=A0ABU4N275_9ACTN|nr:MULTISPECIES: hypothetical protein [Streptomyces]MBE4736824.1 hypothetical protein [Streptomyces caniscabiei]MBE4762093.1 hypothetical protein [Streptomyces caniscabiei]MBE4775396.1 hypothetical protein [Streptomyces caniscabiei]MBE4787059.1 hypothetical protein [Streptomyces caniscabiei]MBE4794686.1 hypothetical protein [Streptomyces caniscabiei]